MLLGAARAGVTGVGCARCARWHQLWHALVCDQTLRTQHLVQQKPPASRTLDAQQTPCASTVLAGPSHLPHASSTPLAQHSARLSSVAPCKRSVHACVHTHLSYCSAPAGSTRRWRTPRPQGSTCRPRPGCKALT